MSEIKQVKIGNTKYDIAAKYLIGNNNSLIDWDYISNLIKVGAEIVLLDSLPTANAENYELYKGDIVFVKDNTAIADSYVEYVLVAPGTYDTTTISSYTWERIGTTSVDLSNYLKKGTTYASAALSTGDHMHSVTVTTVSVDKTKKLGATATGTAVGASGSDTFIKSYPGTTSNLVTTTIKGVSGSTTASKATAGTAFNAVKTVSATENAEAATGRLQYVKSITAVSLGGQTSVPTNAIKSAALSGTAVSSGTATVAVVPTVDANGVLTFESKTISITTAAADTSNVTVSGGAATTKYLGISTTTNSVTPYTFENVTVPVAATEKTVATGTLSSEGTGSTVMTGLGTPTSATAVTGVQVTAQPTITITETTTNTGPVNEHVTTSTASVSTSTDGAHAHNVKAS